MKESKRHFGWGDSWAMLSPTVLEKESYIFLLEYFFFLKIEI